MDAAKFLVEKGANLFTKDDDGDSAIDRLFGPLLLQHAKDLRFASVKSLLILSTSCSTNAPQFDESIAIPPSVIKVFSITGIVRDWIAPFLLRSDIIVRDPSVDVEEVIHNVGRRVEAAPGSKTGSIRRARTD